MLIAVLPVDCLSIAVPEELPALSSLEYCRRERKQTKERIREEKQSKAKRSGTSSRACGSLKDIFDSPQRCRRDPRKTEIMNRFEGIGTAGRRW
ncbi:unnamed protein product [Protopolystoma xenopodis]|uniref:Uncharacterized protein n=1 Tax=Protopolystoma xenopodis TaxID=117903 RepID=A0A448XRY4_9PLAT|nr:unnamed protein product [Protopolystoma xenopodis]